MVNKVECIDSVGLCKIYNNAHKDIWGNNYDVIEMQKMGKGYAGFMGAFSVSASQDQFNVYGIDFQKQHATIEQELSLVCKR
jgi:hypothetical protein